MANLLTYTILGLVVGCIYALSATGLVVTYTTSGIFNFAHGAIGMIAAFCYWELTVHWHWQAIPAFIVVVLLGAPLFGGVVERVLVRPLEGASLDVNLVVTVGLFVFLIGLANVAWNPSKTTRVLPQLLLGHKFKIFLVYITYHEIIVVLAAAAVAIVLRLFFSRTRIGIAMRAVVDNRDLAEMTGARPAWIGQLSWALGAALAALAGVLLAPLQQLSIVLLTLAIVNAFPAAVVGRLRSLTGTALGALGLGLSVTYAVGYLPVGGFLSKIQGAIPMVILFIAVIAMKQERLRTSTTSTLRMPRVPSLGASLGWGAALVGVSIVLAPLLSDIDVRRSGQALALGVVLLSLVLLTGYGGQVSLCQMTFAGAGAYVMGHRLGHHGSPVGLVLGVLLAAGFGALVCIPTVRLRGLYLALATLAFASAMDTIFFTQVFGTVGGGLNVPRLHLPGIPTRSDRAFFILVTVAFALCAVGVLAVRRSRYGRRLAALNDSPAACATLGVNIAFTRLALFTVAAAMAGLGGALYGGVQQVVTPDDFQLFVSLTVLLLLLIGGRNTVIGALLGGIFLAVAAPILQQHVTSFPNLAYLLTGLGAITIGRNPDGVGGMLAKAAHALRAWRSRGAGSDDAQPVPAGLEALEVQPVAVTPPVDGGERSTVLHVAGVSVRFGGVQALDAVDLEVRAGGVTGLIGPNGAGKTTLFNVICGLERPNRGRVDLAGEDVTGLAPHRRARLGLARTFQRLEVFGSLSARDNIIAAAEFHRAWARDGSDPRATADEILGLVGLRAVAGSRVDALPTGLARLVELGRALAARPRLLLLDEPGSGLDIAESDALGDVLVRLAANGMAVLLVEHDVDLVMRVCNPVYVLDFGSVIASGSPRQVQANAAVQAAYLGADAEIIGTAEDAMVGGGV